MINLSRYNFIESKKTFILNGKNKWKISLIFIMILLYYYALKWLRCTSEEIDIKIKI